MNRRVITLIVLFSISIFLALGLLFSVGLLFGLSSSENAQDQQFQDFQYTEINLFGNEESVSGFMTLPKSLITSQEEYITYLNKETGNSIIVTNFGGDQYECTGNCYCSDETANSRRVASASSNILTRGLVILFSAFSVAMAQKIAKESFHEQCVEEYSDTCDPAYILAEAEQCNVKEQKAKFVYDDEASEEKPEYWRSFQCKGSCNVNTNRFIHPRFRFDGEFEKWGLTGTVEQRFERYRQFNLETQEVGKERYGECEEMVLEAQQQIPPFDDLPPALQVEGLKEEDIASYMFSEMKLDYYCTENSRVHSIDMTTKGRRILDVEILEMEETSFGVDDERITKLKREVESIYAYGAPYCVGSNVEQGPDWKQIPQEISNVQCVRVGQ